MNEQNLQPFIKGMKKKGGRKIGSVNRTTAEIKQAFQLLVDNNVDKMGDWLDRIAQDNPEKAIKIIIDLSEFIIPKLSRGAVEVEQTNSIDLRDKLFPSIEELTRND